MSGSASSRRSYADPHGSYTAVAAPLWRRGLAAALDWTLAGVAYLVALIPAGIVQAVAAVAGETSERVAFWVTETAAVGVLVAYFAAMLASGHTLGMRALDVHVRSFTRGEAPEWWRALARSLLAVVFAVASVTAYSYLFGRPPLGEFSAFEETAGRAATAVAAVVLLGQLWMLLDAEGRTLWDRLTGLVVVEDIVPTSMPDRLWSPWGT
jgi:uncharacterized RDD family membrane protein YckC